MNRGSVDDYLRDGCGRCAHYRTTGCKVHPVAEPLAYLRAILRSTVLEETMKWGCPCYTFEGRNVAMLTALRDSCAISFLDGAALPDPAGLLERPGPNSRFARYLRVRSREEAEGRIGAIHALLEAAVTFARSGARVEPKADSAPLPAELSAALAADPGLKSAFEALTPGRQRSHILHIGAAKKAETREARVVRCAPKILAGRGFNER